MFHNASRTKPRVSFSRRSILPALLLTAAAAILPGCAAEEDRNPAAKFQDVWVLDRQASMQNGMPDAFGPRTLEIRETSIHDHAEINGEVHETTFGYEVVQVEDDGSIFVRVQPDEIPDELPDDFTQMSIDELVDWLDGVDGLSLPLHTGFTLTEDDRLRSYSLRVRDGQLDSERKYTPEVFRRQPPDPADNAQQ